MNPATILVTGGSGKLGLSFVKGLSGLGYRVVYTARSQDSIQRVMASLPEESRAGVTGLLADFSGQDGVAALLGQIMDLELKINVLVNNARSLEYLRVDQYGEPSAESWLGEYRMDVVVPYQLSMALARLQPDDLTGIVNVASMYGVVAANPRLYVDPVRQSPIHYSVAKAALIHLTKELAVRLAPRVRVNAISYGGVEGRVDEGFLKRYANLCPSGRMLRDDEVVGALHFLASSFSSSITGHNLVVDGGWTVW